MVRAPVPGAAESSQLRILYDPPTAESVRELSLSEARLRWPDLFRLKPDKRFLFAVAELERLLTGKPSASLALKFQTDHWEILSGGDPVGSLAELPSYAEARELLLARARRLLAGARRAAVPPEAPPREQAQLEMEQFLPHHLIAALKLIEPQWDSRSPHLELVRLSGRAFLWLSLQSVDRLEMADLLRGRAMAHLSLSEALGGELPRAEHALLASLMGYQGDALWLARALPAQDGVRLYVIGPTPSLVKAAESQQDRLLQYLALLRLAESGQEQRWLEWMEAHFFERGMPLSVLGAGLSLQSFEMTPSLADALLHAAMLEMSGEKQATAESPPARAPNGYIERLLQAYVEQARRSLAVKPAGLLRSFESDLARRAAECRGPLWDREAFRAFWRGHFYSALQALGMHSMDSLSSGPAALAFAEYLKDSPPGGPGAQFQRWYSHMAEVKAGTPASKREFDDLAELTDLGAAAVSRVMVGLGDFIPWNPELRAEAVRRLAIRLDGRPSHQSHLRKATLYPLLELKLTEKHCRSRLELAPEDPWELIWCTGFLEGTGELLSILKNRKFSDEARADAVWYLLHGTILKDSEIRSHFRALVRETNYARFAVASYLEYLENTAKDYREVTRGWLSRHDRSEEGLLYSIYEGRLAHLLSLQGRHADAWKMIEPLVATWQGAIMSWAAEILQQLGRAEEAMQLARNCLERYPDAEDTRGRLAELLWRNRRYSEAASVLDPPQYNVSYAGWGKIGKNFAAAFRGQPEGEAAAAFDAILAGRINPFYLQDFIKPLGSERPEIGFRLQAQLKKPGGTELVGLRLRAYEYLRKARGREEALRWLRENLPNRLREISAGVFYDAKEYELLWDLTDPSTGFTTSQFVWNLRAAAWRLTSRADLRRPELVSYFQEEKVGDLHHSLGRYLLGLENEDRVAALVRNAQDRSEAAFFLGIRAVGEGRFEDASDWYHLASHMAGGRGEVADLAVNALGRWYSEGRRLGLLASKKIF